MVSSSRRRGRHRAQPTSTRRWIPVVATLAALLVAAGLVVGLTNALAGGAPADAAAQNAGATQSDSATQGDSATPATARSRADAPARQATSAAGAATGSTGSAEASTGSGTNFGGGSSGFVPPACPDGVTSTPAPTPSDLACDIAPGYPGG